MGLTKSKAYRAYFWSKAAEESSARLMMDLDVQTTGIKAVGKQAGEEPLYDMQGRIVMEPSAKKGIYIQDGKKVVKK